MYESFDDILSRIAERPIWYRDGVPRYEPFSEKHCRDADEVLLVETSCQGCDHRFDIAISWRIPDGGESPKSYKEWIELDRYLPYIYDPPNVPWCNSAHSSSIQVRVLEFWQNIKIYEPTEFPAYRSLVKQFWARVPSLEVDLAKEPLSWTRR